MMKAIEQYQAKVSADKQTALEKLRRAIRAAAPKAEECISYGVPAFRLDGKLLVAFGAARNHCAFYPGAYPIRACRKALQKYGIGKGTIRFSARYPLPTNLVMKLVRARMAERASLAKKA